MLLRVIVLRGSSEEVADSRSTPKVTKKSDQTDDCELSKRVRASRDAPATKWFRSTEVRRQKSEEHAGAWRKKQAAEKFTEMDTEVVQRYAVWKVKL